MRGSDTDRLSMSFLVAVLLISASLMISATLISSALHDMINDPMVRKTITVVISILIVLCIQLLFRAVVWPNSSMTPQTAEEAVDIHYHLGFVATLVAIATSMIVGLAEFTLPATDDVVPASKDALKDFIGTVSMNAGAAIFSTVLGLIIRLFAKDKYRSLYPNPMEEANADLFRFFRPFSVDSNPNNGAEGQNRRTYTWSESTTFSSNREMTPKHDDIQETWKNKILRAFGNGKPKR